MYRKTRFADCFIVLVVVFLAASGVVSAGRGRGTILTAEKINDLKEQLKEYEAR